MATVAVYTQWEPDGNTKILRTYWYVNDQQWRPSTRGMYQREERWPMGWGPWRSPNAG